MVYTYSLADNYGRGVDACDEFANSSDAWLVATAKSLESVIITHEQYNPYDKKKVLLPNICKDFNVQCIDTYDLLEFLDVKFLIENN